MYIYTAKEPETMNKRHIVLNMEEQDHLISPVKAPPFPTQEFWPDISIRSDSVFFTWSM